MYERAMNRFSKELLEAIAKRYNEGKPELIKDDLRRISRKFGIAFADADMERKRIEKQLADEWTRDRSNDKIPKIKNTGAENNADGAFARMRNSVNRDVKRAVDRAIKAKMPTAEAVKIIKRVLGKLRANAATIGRTARMGKIRSDFIRKALADGIRKFRYVGPSGASGTMDGPRTFCQRNLGKAFTIEEILELNNGQGLPVLIYMGGYNCRHWWEAVSENYELRITNDEKNKLRTDVENSYVDEDYTELRNKISEDLKTIKSKKGKEEFIINQIRNLKKETVFVLNKKNELIYHNEADNDSPDSVEANYREKGCSIIHNHPGEDMSFSQEDVEMAIIKRASKIIAASGVRIYTLTIDPELCENDDAEIRFFDIYESKSVDATIEATEKGLKGNEKENYVRREAYKRVSKILKLTTYKEDK